MKYLLEFLETGSHAADRTDESPLEPLLSVLSVGEGSRESTRGETTPTLGIPEPCDSCGRTDWILSLVLRDGGRTCADCASGMTALRRQGVPI
jgi:hypothetical protein